jgi:iron complex outermembrane recepter protein
MKYGILADRLRRSAALGALLTATGAAAFAQQTPPPTTPPPVVTTTPPAEEEDDTADRITVTGSRIQTDSYSSASPMTVVTAEEADVQGVTDISSLLQNSVAAAGSAQTTAAISSALASPPGGLGTSTLSLRGLGAQRTLVLLNGRRAGPAGTGGSVGPFDLNVIPLSTVDRIEIVKDGSSSIYGSDAIAGVVNIITKKDSSSNINFSYTYPEIGAGQELSINGTWGQDFGRGYYRLTADYYHQWEFDRGDNSWFDCGTQYIFNKDGTRADLVDPTTGKYVCRDDVIWGHNWTYDYGENSPTDGQGFRHRPWNGTIGRYQYDYSGQLGNHLLPFNTTTNPSTSGLVNPAGWYPVGYSNILTQAGTDPIWDPYARNSAAVDSYFHPFQNDVTLSPEVERMSILANGEFEVNDGLTLYAEALLNRRTTREDGFSQVYTFQYLYRSGAGPTFGDPGALAAGWTLRGDSTDYYYVNLSPTAITDHADQTVQVDYMRAVAGARGDLPFLTNWTFDLSAQISRSEGRYKEDIFWVDAITDYELRSDFCAGTTTRYRGVPCVDVEWYSPRFNRGDLTAQEKAFLYGTTISETTYQQETYEGYITGPVFDLPAGELQAVVGASFQHDRINDTPDQPWIDREVWDGAPRLRGITRGQDKTWSAFGELSIPLLKDLPLAKEVSMSVSGRYTDVASYGADETYKVGMSWAISDQLRLRGSKGTSFRAPGLYELYLSQQISTFAQSGDPCASWGTKLAAGTITQRMATNCQNDPKFPGGIGPTQLSTGGIVATVYTSGGYGSLEAETSDSLSYGFIWQPEFADFQLSVDYYDIEVNGQVGRVSNGFILNSCYDSPTFPNDEFCTLFTRKQPGETPPGPLKEIFNNYLNIASQTSRGIDIEARYGVEAPIGDLDFTLRAARQLESGTQLLPGTAFLDDNGRAGEPPWVVQLNSSIENGPWSGFWGIRYIDATSEALAYRQANGNGPYTFLGSPIEFDWSTPPMFYHSLSVGYDFEALGIKALFGVRNLFDQEPPKASAATGTIGFLRQGDSVIESAYDLYGRTYFMNVTKTF